MKMISSLFFTIAIVAIILGVLSPVINLFHLPGDFIIKTHRNVFTFPLATSFVLSSIVSITMWLFNK